MQFDLMVVNPRISQNVTIWQTAVHTYIIHSCVRVCERQCVSALNPILHTLQIELVPSTWGCVCVFVSHLCVVISSWIRVCVLEFPGLPVID